jgi:hypothetical protein
MSLELFQLHSVERARGDVLGSAVEPARDRVLGRRLRPVGGEDLIGLAAEQQRLQARGVLGDDLPRLLVEVRRLPAAVLESPFAVLVRQAGPLDDPVPRHEHADDELSHGVLLAGGGLRSD